MVLPHDKDGDGSEDFEAAFNRVYNSEFGFVLNTNNIIVDDVKVHFHLHCLSTSHLIACHTGSWHWENI